MWNFHDFRDPFVAHPFQHMRGYVSARESGANKSCRVYIYEAWIGESANTGRTISHMWRNKRETCSRCVLSENVYVYNIGEAVYIDHNNNV